MGRCSWSVTWCFLCLLHGRGMGALAAVAVMAAPAYAVAEPANPKITISSEAALGNYLAARQAMADTSREALTKSAEARAYDEALTKQSALDAAEQAARTRYMNDAKSAYAESEEAKRAVSVEAKAASAQAALSQSLDTLRSVERNPDSTQGERIAAQAAYNAADTAYRETASAARQQRGEADRKWQSLYKDAEEKLSADSAVRDAVIGKQLVASRKDAYDGKAASLAEESAAKLKETSEHKEYQTYIAANREYEGAKRDIMEKSDTALAQSAEAKAYTAAKGAQEALDAAVKKTEADATAAAHKTFAATEEAVAQQQASVAETAARETYAKAAKELYDVYNNDKATEEERKAALARYDAAKEAYETAAAKDTKARDAAAKTWAQIAAAAQMAINDSDAVKEAEAGSLVLSEAKSDYQALQTRILADAEAEAAAAKALRIPIQGEGGAGYFSTGASFFSTYVPTSSGTIVLATGLGGFTSGIGGLLGGGGGGGMGGGGDSISAALCTVIGWFHGTVGAAIATLAIIVFGVGALMGKVSPGMGLVVTSGIATIFGAGDIASLLGASGGSCG